MTTAKELEKFGGFRVEELANAEPAEVSSQTAHHLRIARTDAEDMLRLEIATLLDGRKTTGGHLIAGYLRKAVPLEVLAGRVVPAIFGLRKLGAHEQANALERDWNDWIAGFNAIAAACPEELPAGVAARRALTAELGGELKRLLEDVVWTLEHSFPAGGDRPRFPGTQ